ncbi:MAG TPA: Xaa-Pro aminopeptidase [Candidatus Eisenbacteria bacterium]|nr:Xaa-Pro aminopeptidase [Candidatus Eisenbacteria bacterium]
MARVLLLVATLFLACAASPSTPSTPPPKPELFGAGLFSTGAWDFFLSYSPDEQRALFCRANDSFTVFQIYETRRDPGGSWRAPVLPRFAGSWSNADPHITLDGRTVLFISNRPGPGQTGPQPTHDIWYATLDSTGEWGDAVRVPEPISMAGVDEWSPSVAANGNLYFGTERVGGVGANDLWVARRNGAGYDPPENLGDSINTSRGEVEPWIARDESYLIFSGRGRPDGVGGFDLYVSHRRNGKWTKARPIEAVNTKALEFNPSVSPDGKWLYFSSTRPHTGPVGERLDVPRNDSTVVGIGRGTGDIYRMSLRAYLR